MKPLVDFFDPALQRRIANISRKNELILRACGLKQQLPSTIIDVTAGLGRDALILASYGARVTMVERNPTMAAALSQALQQYQQHHQIDLTLIEQDGKTYLTTLPDKVDIIYMDPMHPTRKKSALVKQSMRTLRELVGDDSDAAELFECAKTKAKQRVVVKRPLHADTINQQTPDIIYKGKHSRFDVYLV